jgi:hypothetical protein
MIWTGAALVGLAIVVLSLPQCKGICRGIASQVESIGVADILGGLFG